MKMNSIYTYPIEVLKAEIDKLNKGNPMANKNTSHNEKMYHLDKLKQVFQAIELLQGEHLEAIEQLTTK